MSQKSKQELFASLPSSVGPRLEELKDALVSTLGGDLKAVLVFGSAVRGDFRPGHSDVEVMIVLETAATEKLTAIANALALARFSARVEPMILTTAEIPRAADVFPLLYDGIRHSHTVLHGEDPFSALQISDRHRRLRIEQELRETQIRLRRVVADTLAQPAELTAPILRKMRQARAPLHALLQLRKVECGELVDQVIAAAGKLYSIDVAPLSKIREKPADALTALTKLLDAAVHDVDQLESSHG